MATIENVKLDITPATGKAGWSTISYSYELHPDESARAAQREFTIAVGIWGEDCLNDDVLATDLDQHTVSLAAEATGEPIRVQRSFEVETKLLDEDLVGDDEVFLIVEAHSASASEDVMEYRVSGKSNVVKGYF